MKLTREQWRNLEKMPLKKRVERLEEWLSDTSNRLYKNELDKTNEKADNISMTIIIITMLFLGGIVGAFITKLCI